MSGFDSRGRPGVLGWLWSAAFLALVGLLGVAPGAQADPTTAKDAEGAAAGWVKRNPKPLGAKLGGKVSRVETFKDAAGAPIYYVAYFEPAGFAILPADDLVEPVVGFAPAGKYDPSDKNPLGALAGRDLQGRLKEARARIAEAQHKGQAFALAGRFAAARAKWGRLKAPGPAVGLKAGMLFVSDPRVDPLVQSRWDQVHAAGTTSDCYNYYTPNHYPCGCVATAMAQLMRYHQHPTAGVGTASFLITVDSVPDTRSLRGGDGSGGAYDWASMVLVPASGITDPQRQAIGALTHDAGVSVNMSYAAAASTAYLQPAADRLVDTFLYGNAICSSSGGLLGMLNPNLDAGLPALLGILGPLGGHAVVCDGYGYDSATLYHHLNLGWSGAQDAWYNLPDITTAPPYDTVSGCLYNACKTGTGEIISGRVTDAGDLPMSEVSITATRSGGGTYTATTNARGIYALASVPSASSYTVTATKPGYGFISQVASTGTSTNSETGNYWGLDFTRMLARPAVSPRVGSSITNFEYTVSYYDPNGDAPAVKAVYIDELGPYTMALKSGTDADGTYSYTTALAVGDHTYRFCFQNGVGQEATTSTRSDPRVLGDGTKIPTDYDLQGGGCSLAAGPVSTSGALGWLLPYLGLGLGYLLSRASRRHPRR